MFIWAKECIVVASWRLLGGANSRQNHEKKIPAGLQRFISIEFYEFVIENITLPNKWGAKWGDREKVDPCGWLLMFCVVCVYSLVKIKKKNKKNWIFFWVKFCFRFAAFGAKCLECTSNCYARRNCGWPWWRTRTVRPSRAVFPATKLWPLNCWAPYWRLPRRRRLILVRLAVARPPFQWPAHPTAFTWQSPFRDCHLKELTSKRLSSV